jgi:hypothetical protein
MKTNQKILNLIRRGFSLKTLGRLNEAQVDALHKRVVLSEQMSQEPVKGTKTKISGNSLRQGIQIDPKTKVTEVPGGGIELTTLESEMAEAKKKKQKTNPWAVCTTQMGKEFGTTERSEWSKTQMKKYERCVKDVKKQVKESEDRTSEFLERKIQNIVEKHIPPRMTKKDFLIYLKEQQPDIAPSKPKTKPDTKPGKPGEKPGERKNPFKNPNPGEQPGPKAKKSKEMAKKEIIDLIKNILTK